MDNIYDYIDNYGSLSFKEKPLNDIDLAIFALISYVDFSDIVDAGEDKITLNDAAEMYFLYHDKKNIKHNILGVIGGINTLKYIKQKPRYQYIKLYNYVSTRNNNEQFSALFIDVDKRNTVVAFEGTDELISGWKEDCDFAYKFPVNCQYDAISYVNQNVHFNVFRKYTFVGHSKGGNLALVAGMFLNSFKQLRLKRIVSFDGPGLRKQEKKSKEYKNIKKKYNLYVPNYSIVGMMLNNADSYYTVKTTKKGFKAHHLLNWYVTDKEFTKAEISNFSLKTKQLVDSWINKYSEQQLEHFVHDLFMVFKNAEVDSLLDIKITKFKKLYACVKATKVVDKESRAMIIELLNLATEMIFEKKEK